MAGEEPVPYALRARTDHPLGPDLADHPGQVPAQGERGLDPAVRIAEPDQILDPDLGGGHGLLGPADRRDLRPGHVRVESAGVTVGDHAVGDRRPGGRPGRHRAGRPEVDVVRVGGDREDALGHDFGGCHPRDGTAPSAPSGQAPRPVARRPARYTCGCSGLTRREGPDDPGLVGVSGGWAVPRCPLGSTRPQHSPFWTLRRSHARKPCPSRRVWRHPPHAPPLPRGRHLPGRFRPARDRSGPGRDAGAHVAASRVRRHPTAGRGPHQRIVAYDRADRGADRDPGPPRAPRCAGRPATSSRPRITPRLRSRRRAYPCTPGRARPSRSTGGAPRRPCAGRTEPDPT